MKLTADQLKIAEMCNISPDAILSRLRTSTHSADGDADDGDEQDEIQRAQNHLECCRDADEDTMSRVCAARDCLNGWIGKNGGEVKTGSANSIGIVFPRRR